MNRALYFYEELVQSSNDRYLLKGDMTNEQILALHNATGIPIKLISGKTEKQVIAEILNDYMAQQTENQKLRKQIQKLSETKENCDNNLQMIENNEVRREIEYLSSIFKGSFINDNKDFVAVLKYKGCFANEYFHIPLCHNALEVKCKVLEQFSRACYKTSIGNNRIDNEFHQYMRNCVNQYLRTQFTEQDFNTIYTCLGNGVHRDLTITFIEKAFNLKELESQWHSKYNK